MPVVRSQVESASLQRAVRDLQRLPQVVKSKVLPKAMRAGGNVILRAERQFAPVERGTGQLAAARSGYFCKALGLRLRMYQSGARVLAVVGARRSFRQVVGIRKKGKHAGEPVFHVPSKIAHLLERGTIRSRPRPSAGPALQQGIGSAADAIFQAIRSGLQAEGYDV